MNQTRRAYQTIFFDAVGTLIHLPQSVGYHYALAGNQVGLQLDAVALDRAFKSAWVEMPDRQRSEGPREDDDKGWWRELVERVLEEVAPSTKDLDRDAFFEVAYAHFAEAGVWELYPETIDVLRDLQSHYRLGVISNFDGRLRMILEVLGISQFFKHVVISSEVGADKPDPYIFQLALELSGAQSQEALHVGDDPVRDWEGAARAGLGVFQLQRPRNSLRELLAACALS